MLQNSCFSLRGSGGGSASREQAGRPISPSVWNKSCYRTAAACPGLFRTGSANERSSKWREWKGFNGLALRPGAPAFGPCPRFPGMAWTLHARALGRLEEFRSLHGAVSNRHSLLQTQLQPSPWSKQTARTLPLASVIINNHNNNLCYSSHSPFVHSPSG